MIPDDMLLRVLRKPVTRTDADVTLLAEYAAAAADRIEQLKRNASSPRTYRCRHGVSHMNRCQRCD